MNKGTKIRTALAVAVAFYAAVIKTDLTEFGNPTLDIIYQAVMKIATFVVIFLITYYNNDYTEEACIGTGITRQLKAEKLDDYLGERFFDDFGDTDEEVGEEDESENV